MKPPLLALFTLAFIRVIRGLNVFGCGGAALGDRYVIADPTSGRAAAEKPNLRLLIPQAEAGRMRLEDAL